MQIRISDLMDESCPEKIELGAEDRAMARRVNARVLQKLNIAEPKPRRMKKTVRTFLLAAAIAVFMGAAAYAVSGWFMNMKRRTSPRSATGARRTHPASSRTSRRSSSRMPG